MGDSIVRIALYQGAHILLTRAVRLSPLKRRGMLPAKVARARKLAIILRRMWVDGTTFRWGREGVTPWER